MGTASMQKSWRKACGAIKDSTTVGLAKVNSRDFKDLDVAVVKATDHVERPPKERHLASEIDRSIAIPTKMASLLFRIIFLLALVDRSCCHLIPSWCRLAVAGIIAARSLADVSYCVHALARRLSKTRNWVVALKTLVVIHRALREGDPAFREELLGYRRKGHALQMSNFKDDTSPLAWDCSAWVRTYALFLEERLECFRVLRYDIDAERLRHAGVTPKVQNRTRSMGQDDLLEQLPALQQPLFRLVGCQPEGAAFRNYLIQYALALVLKESFKIYCSINDGIINLVNVFFYMTKLDAIKALDIYRRTGILAKGLSEFYEFCRGSELARNFQFPVLREPPSSFLGTMEEYIREAPSTAPVPNKTIEYRQLNFIANKEEQPPEPPPEVLEESAAEEVLPEPTEEPHPASESDDEPEHITVANLLGLSEISPAAAELEESNALALAIVRPGRRSNATAGGLGDIAGSSGWELALVAAQTTISSSSNQLTESKLAGGFDKLLLDSLYEDAARRQQAATDGYGSRQDPFAVSTSVAPPSSVQMSIMAQQQQQYFEQDTTLGMMQQPQYAAACQSNPFGDPYFGLAQPQSAPLQGNSSSLI